MIITELSVIKATRLVEVIVPVVAVVEVEVILTILHAVAVIRKTEESEDEVRHKTAVHNKKKAAIIIITNMNTNITIITITMLIEMRKDIKATVSITICLL